MTSQEMKKTLWEAADKLRAQMDAAEYKHLVLGLIFLKYVSDAFDERRREVARIVADPSSEWFLDEEADRADALEETDYYKLANVFWVPQVARWETLLNQAKQPEIGRLLDDALVAIEDVNPSLKNILDKRFARTQIEPSRLGQLIDLISKIGFTSEDKAKDVLGEVYEYFLGQFATAEGKKRRAVLHARVRGACTGGHALPAQGAHLRSLLRFRWDVRAVGKVHRGARRPHRRHFHLRAGIEPYNVASSGDESGHSRHRLQPRQGAGGHLYAGPAPGPEG